MKPEDERPEYWVFGYGSLMWRPGFPFDRCEPARLVGYHRAFCVYSTNHRGSDARPGLVLGLDRGGVCDGIAFRVSPEHVATTRRYLAEREQINGIYLEKRVSVTLIRHANAENAVSRGSDGRPPETITAQAYIVERAHPSYSGVLSLRRQAHVIRSARGRSGLNLDYLINTLAELQRTGVRERHLQRVGVLAGALFAREIGPTAVPFVAGARVDGRLTVSPPDEVTARPSVVALRNACWRSSRPAQAIPRWRRRRFVHRRMIAAR